MAIACSSQSPQKLFSSKFFFPILSFATFNNLSTRLSRRLQYSGRINFPPSGLEFRPRFSDFSADLGLELSQLSVDGGVVPADEPESGLKPKGSWRTSEKGQRQCDQIGQLIELWATLQSLWQQLFCSNHPHLQAIFEKVSKSFTFLVKYFLGNFYIKLATFYWSNWPETRLQNWYYNQGAVP